MAQRFPDVYCLHDKRKTPNVDEEVVIVQGKGGSPRRCLKCKCAVCGRKKSQFLPTEKSGEGFLDIFKKPSTVLGGLSTVSRFIPVTKPLSIPLALASQGMKFSGHGVSKGGKITSHHRRFM